MTRPERRGRRSPKPAPARASRDAAPAPESPAARRAAVALWATLIALALTRALLAFVPDMHAWSLNLQRFLAPPWAWAPWALAALALLPPVARAVEPAFRRAGEAIVRGSRLAALAAFALGAALTAALPDVVRFVGDFQLRQGAIDEASPVDMIFPQAMPLDAFLHVTLPVRLMGAGQLDANWAPRLLGSIEAGLLALLALAFARALALRGTAALAAAAAVFFGGTLGLFTGYSKVNGEMVLLAVAVGAFGIRATVRDDAAASRRGLVGLGVALALGAFLHRSAIGFVPAAALAFALALRARPGAWREPATWVALALPLAAFGWTGARILHTLTHFDPGMHLASPGVRTQGGLLAAVFAGTRAVDLPNLLVLLAPLAPLLVTVGPAWGRSLPRDRALAVLAALAAPFLGLLLFVHPWQGAFRDYDTLAGPGITTALLAAWLAGETLRRLPGRAWLGVAVALAAAAPSVQWIAHQTDVERGLARVTAFMTEPPRRDPIACGTTWDYLGIRNFNLEHWDAAASAFARAAETQPSPRILIQWAMAETMRNDLPAAERLYTRALEKDSTRAIAWQGYGVVSLRQGKLEQAHRAVVMLLRVDPANAEARGALRDIERLMAGRRTRQAGGR
jgi:hypothetical protein